jgi:putative redox protein
MALIASALVDCETKYATSIHAGGHHLTADEPEARGGTNTGPAPFGLLLAAVGACTTITLRMYAERKGWELGAIHVDLRLVKTPEGAEKIERGLRFGGTLDDEQRARLLEIADKTPVTKTVRAGTAIETRLL